MKESEQGNTAPRNFAGRFRIDLRAGRFDGGLRASNDPPLVEEIIRALGATGDEIVPAGKTKRRRCGRPYCATTRSTTPTPKFLKAIVERASAAPLLEELLAVPTINTISRFISGGWR